jgi:hypothetical protein
MTNQERLNLVAGRLVEFRGAGAGVAATVTTELVGQCWKDVSPEASALGEIL